MGGWYATRLPGNDYASAAALAMLDVSLSRQQSFSRGDMVRSEEDGERIVCERAECKGKVDEGD